MANEDRLWQIARDELKAGRKLVLCSVIAGVGSTPREVGARMLVAETGLIAGTVGGGCGESEVLVHARKLMAGAEGFGDAIVEVDLSGDFEQTEIQACGGEMDVAVQSLTPDDLPEIERVAEAEAQAEPVMLALRLPPGERRIVVASHPGELPDALTAAPWSDKAASHDAGGERWLLQKIGLHRELVIVGSGHVAQPLARFAAANAMRVLVLDDRPSYVTGERFPDAHGLKVGAHDVLLAELRPNIQRAVVIITRGHQHDEASLRAALRLDPAPFYVGMIGSKRRAIGTLKRLRHDGYDEALLERVRSPIGLDIGALTPEEIAIAILAEVIASYRKGSGRPLAQLRTQTPAQRRAEEEKSRI